MANELQTNTTSGSVVYALIRTSQAQVYDVSTNTFGSYVAADVPNYAVPLVEQGTGSGYYVGNFPTEITTPDTYSIEFYQQLGSTPASTDTYISGGSLQWSGSSAVSNFVPNLISLSYLQTYMNSSNNPALQQQVIQSATQAIQSFCNRVFSSQTYSEYYDGPGDRSLLLRQRPIITLTSVTILPYGDSPQVVDGSEFIVGVNTGIISFMPSSQYGCYFFYGHEGESKYLINYTAGFLSIPADIQQACALICQNLINWSGIDVTLKVERLGGTSGYQWGGGVDTGKMIPSTIKPILEKYKSYIV